MAHSGKSVLTRRQFQKMGLSVGLASALPRWLHSAAGPVQGAPLLSVSEAKSLRTHAAARGLLYGAAVDAALLDLEGVAAGNSTDGYSQLVLTQAGILVAENAMKWKALRPSATGFDFTQADRVRDFATLAGQQLRGHNLCWHLELPSWFESTATKENARQILVQHINVVAGHYRGRMHSWDVVNEAVEPADNRPDGLRNSPWLKLIGPEYIELAFQTASQADPFARLTYNDYGIELDTPAQSVKRGQVLLLLRRLKARGVPLHAVGVQSHLQADGPQPGAGLLTFIREAAKLGLEVYITEMDVNTHSLAGRAAEQDIAVAQVYKSYMERVLAEPNVPVALTWGLTSAHSWLNETEKPWVKRPDGARQRPLPFDDNLQPTPAFAALCAAIDASRPVLSKTAAPESGVLPAVDPGSLYKPFAVKGSPTTTPAAGTKY
jgi:endo-1,4-beta-xylanase